MNEFLYFLVFQVIAFIVLFLSAFAWGIKRGQDEGIVLEALPPLTIGLIIYCLSVIVGGTLGFIEVLPFPNRWFVYLGLAAISAALSGFAPTYDSWGDPWKKL